MRASKNRHCPVTDNNSRFYRPGHPAGQDHTLVLSAASDL